MHTRAYPGKGLSLPQLVFALNAELKNMAYSPSLTLDQFSQLAKDILAASTAIHERRNSLAPVNRLPLDVICLVPMHLASLGDRLRVTFVCRHWRRTFLQHATLWSQLHLAGGMDQLLVRTLLGRAKGSPLDITADYNESPIHYVTLLSPFAQQIRSLELKHATESDEVQDLSVAISGPLPLLHTLKIDVKGYLDGPDSLVAPTLPLFKNATNLKRFVLDINEFPSLRHFTFPNLTSLCFFTSVIEYPVSELLNFLEASPALRWITIRIEADRFCEDIPSERVIVLPCVEVFSLIITSYGPGCEITTHISCPFAKSVEFVHEPECAGDDVPEAIYPPSKPWNAIVHQYTKGTVERVVLEMIVDDEFHIDCFVTFGSSDGATLRLFYNHYASEVEHEMEEVLEERIPRIFPQAFQVIRDHPLLASVKHLCIRGGNLVARNLEPVANAVGQLFGSMGPLENLTLDGCDLRPYLDPFLAAPLFPHAIQPASFPPIMKLVIINPVQSFHDKACAAAVVELTRSQYTRGVPLECVEFRTTPPSLVIDKLAAFVDTVEWSGETQPSEDVS